MLLPCARSGSIDSPGEPPYLERAVFDLVSSYAPAGDQPQAIAKLTEGVLSGAKHQTLLGVTGSGKTFTAANLIRNVGRPTLGHLPQ